MTNRIKVTFQEGDSGEWANGKTGWMRYDSAKTWYQFAGLHYEGTTPYKDHDDIAGLGNIENFPILSKGITSHILLRLEKTSEIKIYTYYYQACLSKFIDVENKKPGANTRNLDSEFYSIHLNEEKERIKFSQKIREYISDNELEIINKYIQAYLTHIEQVYSPSGNMIDHSKLLYALSEYISGINAVGFSHIIEHHSLIDDRTQKEIWKGKPADAHRFATFLDMKLPAFNKCFSLSIGRELKHNDKNETFSPITAILKDYFKK